MKYVYETATGPIEVEVDEHFYDILTAMDREERNSERKHSRRQAFSIDSVKYGGRWCAGETDLLDDLILRESNERLHMALTKLTPNQQSLIAQIYFKNEKVVDVALRNGVSPVAIQNRLSKIYSRLEKILY